MNQLDHQKAFDDARVVWERIDNLRELHDATLTVLAYPWITKSTTEEIYAHLTEQMRLFAKTILDRFPNVEADE